jgi:hypothetical protein
MRRACCRYDLIEALQLDVEEHGKRRCKAKRRDAADRVTGQRRGLRARNHLALSPEDLFDLAVVEPGIAAGDDDLDVAAQMSTPRARRDRSGE